MESKRKQAHESKMKDTKPNPGKPEPRHPRQTGAMRRTTSVSHSAHPITILTVSRKIWPRSMTMHSHSQKLALAVRVRGNLSHLDAHCLSVEHACNDSRHQHSLQAGSVLFSNTGMCNK